MIVATALLLALAGNPGFTVPPVPQHYVTDNAGALSETTRAAVESELKSYEAATGHQVIVFIAPSTGGVPLEDYTGQTADQWKIGRKGKDDGAVLFLFTADHKVRIEVGYGLEAKLTDADSKRIIEDEIVPQMRNGDPNGAVTRGVAAMLATISPSYKTSALPSPEPSDSGTLSGPATTIVLIIFAIFFLFIAVVIVAKVIGVMRYGYLIVKEGSAKADKDMRGWWFWGGVASGAGMSSGWSSGGGGGGGFSGFSAGGGGFGGGGASGSW